MKARKDLSIRRNDLANKTQLTRRRHAGPLVMTHGAALVCRKADHQELADFVSFEVRDRRQFARKLISAGHVIVPAFLPDCVS